jgi:glutamate synthase (NADPH/NADH) small chain
MKTYQNFIEHLRDDRLRELSKIELLESYREIDEIKERLRQEEDLHSILQHLNGGQIEDEPTSESVIKSLYLDTHEVNIGLEYLESFHRADGCLECSEMPCSTGKLEFSDEIEGGCPVLIDVPGFIKLIKEGKIFQSWLKLMERDSLPAITGRVCPQEVQCQLSCSLAIKDDPVEIGRLERFVADYVWENHPDAVMDYIESLRKKNAKGKNAGHHVAVIGSGPAGLTVACDLAILGYKVTIFESLHIPGGVLAYGIPVFRLPKKVLDRELQIATMLGVKFVFNVTVGRSITVNELFDEGFSSVFIGTGAGLPRLMKIPGENLNHVYSANEFLVRINLMKAYQTEADTPVKVGKNTVVVGGGFTAIDAARWAKRLGSENVTIMYRRSREEMPARVEEVENAIEEGIDLQLLTNPVELLDNGRGEVKAMRVVKMELGEPDSSGRRRPIPIEGSEYEVPVDTMITALGTTPNPIILETTKDLKGSKWGTIEVEDPFTGETSLPSTYAGGDAVTGAATVILAMGAGKWASEAIDKSLQEKKSDPEKFKNSMTLVEEFAKPYIIKKNEPLVPDVYEMVVQAPVVSRYCKAGQFVLAMANEESERIPLTIADWDNKKGEITLVYQVVGKSTADFENLRPGDELRAISGPLGKPSEIKKMDNKVLMVAGGVGLAAIYPIMRAHHEIGNDVYLIYGARNRELFFWLDRIKKWMPEGNIFLSTDDGTLGTKGFVTDVIKEEFLGTGGVDFSVIIGPAIMMRESAKLVTAEDIPTMVSLNPIMLDGSAMCGGCKVSKKTGEMGSEDFACHSGPDRFAHEVDLDELVSRLSIYQTEECDVLIFHIKQELRKLLTRENIVA